MQCSISLVICAINIQWIFFKKLVKKNAHQSNMAAVT